MGERHGRQSRLAGIGAEGQARIGRTSVEVRLGGLAGEVAARYLAGAGVGGLTVPSEAVAAAARAVDGRVPVEVDGGATSSPVHGPAHASEVLEDAAAAEVLEGARFALRAIKRALEAAR
ncbi:MAG TPA: hypothetical protein VGG39_34925 [Polyangiaceae bacterium]|jgi:hypothetical protein